MGGLISRLTRGLDTHIRADNSVIRLHAGGHLIGEVVVNEHTIRVNFKNEFSPEVELVAMGEGIRISGRSKSWAGGLRVTSENADAVKHVLDAIADEVVEVQQVDRSVRESIAALERAAQSGYLDDTFERDIQRLLERRPNAPVKRGRRSRRARTVSAG